MGLSWSHVLIVVVVAILLFGRGKISELMGEVAQGIKSFRKGLADDEKEPKRMRNRHKGRPKVQAHK